MKLDVAIRAVRDAETEVAQQLNALGERHKADHDVFHLTETLQPLAHANLQALAPVAERYEVTIDANDAPEEHREGLVDKARERTSELLGRRPETALLLLPRPAQAPPPLRRSRSTGCCSARVRRRRRTQSCSTWCRAATHGPSGA